MHEIMWQLLFIIYTLCTSKETFPSTLATACTGIQSSSPWSTCYSSSNLLSILLLFFYFLVFFTCRDIFAHGGIAMVAVWIVKIYFYLGFIISWAHKAFTSSKNNYSSGRQVDSASLQYSPSSIKHAQTELTLEVLVSNTLQVTAGR